MSDHCEEQEMEAEALTAIFDDCMEILNPTQPFEWCIKLWPEQHTTTEDDDEGEVTNHVGIKLIAKIPLDYPELSLPTFQIEIMKGLTKEHRKNEKRCGIECRSRQISKRKNRQAKRSGSDDFPNRKAIK